MSATGKVILRQQKAIFSDTYIRCEQMTKVRLSSKYKVLPFSLSGAIGAYCIKSKHRVICHIREA